MSPSADRPPAHGMPHELAAAELPAAALGGPLDPALSAHVATCARCTDELATLRSISALARSHGTAGPGPSPEVWTRIARELADPAGAEVAPGRPAAGRPARRRAGRALAATLALAAVLVAAVVGWQLGRDRGGHPAVVARATLVAVRGTAPGAQGDATMRASRDGYQMDVTTTGLPAPGGYYEVWLLDASTGRMVAVGTLGTGARGTFTVPAGIDTGAYHVVDVSAQRYDGTAAHERSVLRGALVSSG